jgi:hypothetical protein
MEWKHELDELINAGLGDIPQPNIPPNWRELMREVYSDPKQLIIELEAKECTRVAELDEELAQMVMRRERERVRANNRGARPGVRRGPYKQREPASYTPPPLEATHHAKAVLGIRWPRRGSETFAQKLSRFRKVKQRNILKTFAV